MTTIVGVQGDGFAVICVDSRISTMFAGGLSQISTLKEGSSKVSTNGKYLLGAAGDVRAINILHHVFQPPTPPPNLKGKKLDQFFTAKFIPALRECFDAQGYSIPDLNENKEHIAEQGSSILVVINGTIYIVDGDYSWASDASGIYTIGSGSAYALGALQVLANNKKLTIQQSKTLALKALTIAAKYDPHTGAPYQTFIQECEANNKRRKPV